MAAITWNKSMSVKINSIDEQHIVLIEMINDFYENINNRSNNENISKLISGMKKYTIMHFNIEEKYMQQFKYPSYETHKKEHDEFIAKVNALEEKFNNGTLIISFEITSFIKDWIKDHIQFTDMKYSDFFIRNGVI